MKNVLKHALLLGLGLFIFTIMIYKSVQLMTAVQLFTSMNVKWGEYQKQGVNELYLFSISGDEDHYQNFVDFISKAQNIRQTIEEISETSPDQILITNTLADIRVDSDIINQLLEIDQYFGSLDKYSSSDNMWHECSVKIDQILKSGEEIFAGINNNTFTSDELLESMLTIHYMDASLTSEVENIFSELNNDFIVFKNRILRISIISGLLILIYGFFVARMWLKINTQLSTSLESQKKLADFPNSNPNPVLEITEEGKIVYVNNAALRIFPTLNEEGLNHPFLKEFSAKYLSNSPRKYKSTQFLVESNDLFYEQVVHHSPSDSFHIYAIEVTELMRKKTELEILLTEKQILLSEVHHRVNNNMAVISGFLEMESDSNDEKCVEAIERSIARIQVIARINKKIHGSHNFASLNAGEILTEIAKDAQSRYLSTSDNVLFEYKMDPVIMNVNQLLPLSLICNELISSIFKNRNSTDKQTTLQIHLTEIENQNVRFCLHDPQAITSNGTSIFEYSATGVEIVQLLTKQLEGELEINRSKAQCDITFTKKVQIGTADAYFSTRQSNIEMIV